MEDIVWPRVEKWTSNTFMTRRHQDCEKFGAHYERVKYYYKQILLEIYWVVQIQDTQGLESHDMVPIMYNAIERYIWNV